MFAALKQALFAAPVLQLLDFEQPFIVDYDVSGFGFGVVAPGRSRSSVVRSRHTT